MADLVHDPLHVEVVGEQGDRDVRAPEGVRRGVRQRRQASRAWQLAGKRGRLADDLADALAVHPSAAQVRDQVVLWPSGAADAPQAVDVLDDRLDEVGRHLHLADAGLGLGVGDVEAGARGVVQAQVADLDVAQLARAHACAAQDLDDDASPDVATPRLQAEPREVVGDGGLGESELLCDLARLFALRVQLGDMRGCEAELAGAGICASATSCSRPRR